MLHILVDIGLDNSFICLIGHGHCYGVVLEEEHAYKYMVFYPWDWDDRAMQPNGLLGSCIWM